MKKLSLLIFALFAFSSGCIENSRVVIEKPLVVFKASYETIASSTPIGGPPPTALQVEISGEGTATHLGKSTLIAVTTQSLGGPPPFSLDGGATFVAANGDEFYTKATGTASPNFATGFVNVTTNHIIIGGTGRFKNAKGDLVGTAVSNISTGIGRSDFEGTISY